MSLSSYIPSILQPPFDYIYYYTTEYPLLSQCITSGILWSISDIVAQILSQRKSKHITINYKRTAYLALYSSVFWCNVCILWYQLLIQCIPGDTIINVLIRVIIDQTVFTSFLTVSFILYVGLTSGATVNECKQRIQQQFTANIKLSWTTWIPISFLNTTIVPIEYRMILINAVNVPFTIILAYRTSTVPTKIIAKTKVVPIVAAQAITKPTKRTVTKIEAGKQLIDDQVDLDTSTDSDVVFEHEKV